MMTLQDVAALLAVIAATDRRKVGETDILTWHATVGHLDFEQARAAVWEHFATSTEWLMPAHINGIVRAHAEAAKIHEKPHTMSRDTAPPSGPPVSMPDRIKEIYEERWGPRETWVHSERLSKTPRVTYQPKRTQSPGPDAPQQLSELMREQWGPVGEIESESPRNGPQIIEEAPGAPGAPQVQEGMF